VRSGEDTGGGGEVVISICAVEGLIFREFVQ